MKPYLLACLVLLLLPFAASAASITQDMRYSYTRLGFGTTFESGPGATFPHPYYKVAVAPGGGLFTASHHSRMNATYEPELASPGFTTVDLRLIPVSASLRATQGVSATVGLGRDPWEFSQPLVSVGVGLSVDVRASGTGAMNTSISGSDIGVTQPEPGLGIPFVLTATASPSLAQSATMQFGAMRGTVFYRNRDTGHSGTQAFVFSSSHFAPVSLNLIHRGTYDVSISSPSFEAGLTQTFSTGVSFNVNVLGSGVINPPPTINHAPPNQITGAVPFQLNSADRNALQNWFTITVVPEPSTWALCCMALPAAWIMARRRRAGPSRR